MKIAYITRSKYSNKDSYSGTDFFIGKHLRLAGFDVEYIDQIPTYPKFFCKIFGYINKLIYKKDFICDYNVFVCKFIAFIITRKISKDTDVILATNSILLSYIKTTKTKVFWTDATFAGLVNFYPDFSNLSNFSLLNGNKVENKALNNVDIAVYSSDWAAETAIKNYNFDTKKIRVIPYGCNLDISSLESRCQLNINKQFKVCKLLFVGKEWDRKGGEKVIEVAKALLKLGVPVELRTLGTKPLYDDTSRPFFIKEKGFISKNIENGQDLIDDLYKQAHFLIILPKAECAAMVFAEANSFGLPVISSNVGGISTVVKNNINGKLFELSTSPIIIAQNIKYLFENKQEYYKLSKSSYKYFLSNLNWDVAVSNLKKVITNEE